MNILTRTTPEQRKEALKLACIKLQEDAAHRLANEHKYKLKYLDEGYWDGLTTKHKIRRPPYNEPASKKLISKYLRKLKVHPSVWVETLGKIDDWLVLNPTWTAVAAVGLILEMKEGM